MNPVTTMRVNKFVIDTNIRISYFITGREQKLITVIKENGLSVFSCHELINEIREVLGYPHLQKFNIRPVLAVALVRRVTVYFELTYPIKSTFRVI